MVTQEESLREPLTPAAYSPPSATELPALLEGMLETRPVPALMDALPRQERSKLLEDPDAVPSRSVMCRLCPQAQWQVVNRTVVCNCLRSYRLSWTPGVLSSDRNMETTLCDEPLAVALKALLKKAQAETRQEETGNGSPSAETTS